jgi:hypothetical protein
MKKTTLRYCLAMLIIRLVPIPDAMGNLPDDPQGKPSEILHRYMLNHPNETFVIQTDRDLYFSGTELWFSVWSLDDQILCPFSYSGIVNVELMDKNGKSMEQQTLQLLDSRASGRIILPEQTGSGTFYLRAYSNLQRNYGEHLFGIKIIQVINPSRPPELALEDTLSKPAVSVFPEGQRLLRGITNKLVIKATYSNGIYAELRDGFLIRQPDDTIAQLEFLVPGLGYCSFYADTSSSYFLDLPCIDIIPLEIQEKGLSLNVQKEISQLKLRVLGEEITDGERYYLVGKSRGLVFFEQVLEQGLKEVNFPYSSLPEGLLEFSILTSSFEEYCQRLYYHDVSTESTSADLVFRKSSFKKGESIDMDIQLPEDQEFGLLSLSIRKDLFIDHTLNQNFKSCTDLHPYLNDWDEFEQLIPVIPKESLADLLDVYLITRRSSRFKWKNISHGLPEKLEFMPEVDSRRVTGYGFNPVNGTRFSHDNLVLFFVGKQASILNSSTDDDGRFSFAYPVQKTGLSEFVIQAFGHEDKMEISLNWPYHPSNQNYQLDFFHFDSSRFDEYDRAYIQSFLEKMYKNKDESITAKKDPGISFYGVPDFHTQLKDYVSMRDMEEVFKEIIIGEKISARNDEFSIQLFHRDKNVILGDNPLILFNGAPVLNFEDILDLPVSEVDIVDLVRQHYRIENQVFDGIINVVSNDLNLQLKIPPNAYRTKMEVFPAESRFSRAEGSPVTRIPYLNPTLYWNPNLSFEGNTGRITFQAGQNSGRYQVLLRGIDTKGKVLELVRYITIE